MDTSTIVPALAGGSLIGLGAVGLLATHGRIAGVSGLIARCFEPGSADRPSRAAFLLGLVASGFALSLLAPASVANHTTVSLPIALVAGVVVGLGARLGNGCTSGHGVCGAGRMRPRSLVATTLFAVFGAAALLVSRGLAGGAS